MQLRFCFSRRLIQIAICLAASFQLWDLGVVSAALPLEENLAVGGAKKYGRHAASTDIDTIAVDEGIAIIRDRYYKEVKAEVLINGALSGMVRSLDAYSEYLSPSAYQDLQLSISGKFVGIGVELVRDGEYVKIVAVIEGSPAARAGLKAGDIITHVHNKPVEGMPAVQVSNVIRNGESPVRVKVMREEKTIAKLLEFSIKRTKVEIPSIKTTMHGSVLVINIYSFSTDTYNDFIKALQVIDKSYGLSKLDGIVIDLRRNPGGLLIPAADIAGTFLPNQAKIVSINGKDNVMLGEFVANPEDYRFNDTRLIILIDENTASAAEILASALRDHGRCVTMGKKSFGKGLVQDFIPMFSLHGAIKISIAKYQTPNGSFIENVGIIPDIILTNTPTLSGYDIDGKSDSWLSSAIDLVTDEDRYKGEIAKQKLRGKTSLPSSADQNPSPTEPAGLKEFRDLSVIETSLAPSIC